MKLRSRKMYYNIFVVLLCVAGYLAIKMYKAHETEREKRIMVQKMSH